MGYTVTWGQLLVLTCGLLTISGQGFSDPDIDLTFNQFLQDNGYRGGAVAAMKDGELLLAKGFGTDRAGHEVTAQSTFHTSSVAKSLTAVALLQLVQEARISLKDKVFGELGVLSDIQPWNGTKADPRVYEITVDHLLHHAAGWDDLQGPLLDPVLNQFYHIRHASVPNIAKLMKKSFPLEAKSLISYVISQPLRFDPGTNVAYSNIAYLILGRVIEAVTDITYSDYVKRFVLNPCGMWNTHLGIVQRWDERAVTVEDQDLYYSLDGLSVDSALGWYSNVYDMVRFLRCTFETDLLLKDKTPLYAQPDITPLQQDSWYGAGFLSDSRAVWQEANTYTDDLILRYNMDNDQDTPDSWVVLLYDSSKRGDMREQLQELMDSTVLQPQRGNLFYHDLSDIPWVSQPKESQTSYQITVKFSVNEHHLQAYVKALQTEGLSVQWFTSHTLADHTNFLVVSRRIAHPSRSQYDYILEHGMDHRHLLKKKMHLEELGYNMTQLHSYISRSHVVPIRFAAIFRYEAFSLDKQMKYGTGHLPEPYEKLVQMYYEKSFYPISQTIVYNKEEGDEEFSFIFVKDSDDIRVDFKHHYDLSSTQLMKTTEDNAKSHLYMSYLNSYSVNGKPRFSAIYTNGTKVNGHLYTDRVETLASEIITSQLNNGIAPKFIVPYTEDEEIKYAMYMEAV